MVGQVKKLQEIRPMFSHWEDGALWACLDGIMGKVYANDEKDPTSAVAILGDFAYFVGQPEKEILSFGIREIKEAEAILVPCNQEWKDFMGQELGSGAKVLKRYAMKNEPDIFCREDLEAIIHGLPKEYQLVPMDEKLFTYAKETPWCQDWVNQYPTYEEFKALGLGMMITKDKMPISGATSYASFHQGIEVEIMTHKDYRRLGLAKVCGAGLILACLERGWNPHWDARIWGSVLLAKSLGYHYSHPYDVYSVKKQ